jgi:hypothetical protein
MGTANSGQYLYIHECNTNFYPNISYLFIKIILNNVEINFSRANKIPYVKSYFCMFKVIFFITTQIGKYAE